MKQGRLPWPTEAELDDSQNAILQSIVRGPRGPQVVDGTGRVNGPLNAALFAGAVGDAVQRLGAAIRFEGTLSGRARELVILDVSRAQSAAYEWESHSRTAEAATFSPAQLEALRTGDEVPGLAGEEAVVLRVARALTARHDLDDDLVAAGLAALGTEGMTEIVYIVGYYNLIALSLRVWRTPLRQAD